MKAASKAGLEWRWQAIFASDAPFFRRLVSQKKNASRVTSSPGRRSAPAGGQNAAQNRAPGSVHEALRAASTLHMGGDLPQAERLYRQALSFSDTDGHALHGLGVIAFQRGAFDEARQLIAQAIRRLPGIPLFHFNLAKSCASAGDFPAAIEAYRQALSLDPRHLPSLENLGKLLARLGRNREAIPCLHAAVSLRPDHAGLRRALAMTLWRANEYDQVVAVYAPAVETPIDRLKLAIMATARIDSRAGIDAACEHLRQTLAALETEVSQVPSVSFPGEVELEMNLTCFHVAYQGGNVRDLLASLGRLLARAYPALNYVAPHCRPGVLRPARVKPRVGFVSAYFREHSVSNYFSGIVRGIDRSRFELWVFSAQAAEDEVAVGIRDNADHYLVFAPTLVELREQIAAAELDLLIYVDLGMDPLTYLTAFARLAPVQATTYGHPLSSGVPNIDWFVSHAGVEPEDAAAHYSERLYLLPPDSTFASFSRPTEPPVRQPRSRYGLAEGVPLYLCTQHLLKVHPDFDEVLRDLLVADPDAVVAIVSVPLGWHASLKTRLAATLGELTARVLFLPYQTDAESYFGLYGMCDAVLDTPYFGGGVTSFHALAMNAPVVTLPGPHFRSRQTFALYRRMGISSCVASDRHDYVAIARRLARDADFARTVRAEIAARSDRIFDDPAIVEAWNRALADLLAAPPG